MFLWKGLGVVVTICLVFQNINAQNQKPKHVQPAEAEDNEFAEFEKYDDESIPKKAPAAAIPDKKPDNKVNENSNADGRKTTSKNDEATVENDQDEFSHLMDNEEFEGFDKGKFSGAKKDAGDGRRPTASGDLKFAKVPVHLTGNWEAFYMEMLMMAGLAVYLLNFVVGKSKNARLARAWFDAHEELLAREFQLVGDDGEDDGPAPNAGNGTLLKESEHMYSLWCSGRVYVESLLVELKLIKRQDVVSLLAKLLKPVADTVTLTLTLDEAPELDGFVCAVVQRKRATQLVREHADLASFCPERRPAAAFDLPSSFCVLSEIGEATTSLLDHKVCAVLTRFEANVEYLHVSDQYSGARPVEAAEGGGSASQPAAVPETKRVLVCAVRLGRRKGATSAADMASVRPLLQMLLYLADKLRKIRLSKEAKARVEKNRMRVAESVEKTVHAQRQEAAQLRREEKHKADKERLLAEEDPERARRLEARVDKAETKRKGPRMKMLKAKGV